MEFPHTIAARLGSAAYQENFTGKSDASVLMFDDYVLKIRPGKPVFRYLGNAAVLCAASE